MEAPICTICKPIEKNRCITATQEYDQVNDVQALLNRFPYLKDLLCKINSDEMHNLIKDKHETTYDSDFKKKHHDYAKVYVTEEGIKDGSELCRPNERVLLKRHQVQRSGVKYSGIAPSEPYVLPISEYRSTIHTLGTRIIKEHLLVPRVIK